MIATLTRIFGPHNLDLAEDVVQETLCRALDQWRFGQVPENPAAWLMLTAKNRAIDVIRRQRHVRHFGAEFDTLLSTEWATEPSVHRAFFADEIEDDQLRMMFTCCHPSLPAQAQVMLVLKTLCGFGVGEIAQAFLATPAAVEKRLTRARKSLAESRNLFEISDSPALRERADSVRRALYLLFSEGYHASHGEQATRAELCAEAIRLGNLLAQCQHAAQPTTHALLALFCLHAARIPGRVSDAGQLIGLAEQDRSRWDRALIGQGMAHLGASATGDALTGYHLEAGIAAMHCQASRFEDTDWPAIRAHYELLFKLRPTPVVALNRAIALSFCDGPSHGLAAIDDIAEQARLHRYPFFHATLAELCRRAGRHDDAQRHLERAVTLARTPAEGRYWSHALAHLDDAPL